MRRHAWTITAIVAAAGLPGAGPLAGQDPGALDPPPRAVPVEEPESPEAQPGAAVDPDEPGAAGDMVTASRSGQFRIRGAGMAERGAVAALAEDLKDELLRLTGADDAWETPVLVMLHGTPGDPRPRRSVAARMAVIEGRFRLQLDLHVSRGIDHDQFDPALLAMLVYEWTLRGRGGGLESERLLVRPWLVEGLREAVRWRQGRSDRNLYAALFRRGGLVPLEELMATGDAGFEALDAAARAAFRVSAGALVLALLEQPDGRVGFRAFLAEIAAFEGDPPLLMRRHFPGLNVSEESLEKWWALQLASQAEARLAEVLGVRATDAALTAALELHLRDPQGLPVTAPVDDPEALATLNPADRAAAVRPAQDALVRLSYRCFPPYRPILAEYQAILADLAAGRGRNPASRLAALAERRTRMVDRATDARDFLDWFEITRARATSGKFDDYLRLKQDLEHRPTHHDDPLSLYLDGLQQAFDR